MEAGFKKLLMFYSRLILPSDKKGHVPDLYKRIRKSVIELTPCIHGARLSESAAIVGKQPDELLDFSVNLNPLGHPKIEKLLVKAAKDIGNYPDNRYPDFRKAAADYLKVSPDNIIPGNGSSELIRLFAETVIQPGDKVIIPSPTFGEYEFQCRFFGARIEYAGYQNILDIEPQNYKAVFLCNPNNPTGSLAEREKVLELARKCSEAGTFLFVDEAFIELSDPAQSVADIAASTDFVIVLRSLTKSFAIPGIRIGFAVASARFADILNNVRLHWNLNSVALDIGTKFLRNKRTYLEKSLSLIKKEREWLLIKLGAIRGFRPYQSDTNFILVDLRDFSFSSAELVERILKKGIIIRECTSFGLENHIRVAVRKRRDNQRLVKVLSIIISDWGNELAKKEICEALDRGITARSRLNCEYYPCHFEGQDCTFCFCPFYPCEDERTGGELIQRTTGGSVWSCAGCRLIHRGDIAEKALKELMKGKKIKEVWKTVMEPELE